MEASGSPAPTSTGSPAPAIGPVVDSDPFLRQLLSAMVELRDGNFAIRLPSNLTGLTGKVADVFNDLASLSDRRVREVARVSRMVGEEGKLRERVHVDRVSGACADEIAAINALINDLVWPTLEITRAVGAVGKGDLTQYIDLVRDGRPLEGEFLRSAKLVNTMIDQLALVTGEVTRVAREVGSEGKLGGEAVVPGVAGTWKDLTDSVNAMASNLTGQVRNIAAVTTAVARGDLSRKITVDVKGELLELKDTINTMVDQLNAFASEVSGLAREVGTEGRLGGHADVPDVAGTWKDLTDAVNLMVSHLTAQMRNIAEVTTAVARGDLSRKITVHVRGELLQLKNAINTMVEQLRSFASEVTRVAREVGTEGKLGGQARVPDVAGTWKDLTDSVNVMADNLTTQVRGIAKVVHAVADGDLHQKLTVEAKGEIAALAETINSMTDTLATFADQVTNVAREVGVEGRLGGQANVPGAAGTWKDLTGNVNRLAANLTTQVRAIAKVATAVTQGDLTRAIQVEARGEVADLKDNINTMIDRLRATTESNQEQDWLKTNLAKFARMLQGQRDLVTVGRMLLSELAPLVSAQHGAVYLMQRAEAGSASAGSASLELLAAYARGRKPPQRIAVGEGLVGQCAVEKRKVLLNAVPEDYVRIQSSLGGARPATVIVLPVLFEGETKAVIELASLQSYTGTHIAFLEQLTDSIGVVFNTIETTMQTENLLEQSQQLTLQLQTRQAELQRTNEELASNAQQLAERNVEVERKNKEVELARLAVEDKAAELALTSKYKSEFLANMSHELRTPLNSVLLLAQQLAENASGNLSEKQVEFARSIHASGNDLLNLITDILDLSKIESGTVTVEADDVAFVTVRDSVEHAFRHVAESKGLAFQVDFDAALPDFINTDAKRLKQIVKNLLSNAFKFTSRGRVAMTVREVDEGWTPGHPTLTHGGRVVAFAVADTGIGIAADKQKLIFEAFHQADAGTSRKYGGTGLGLAISRELAALLGGEIRVVSVPGQGSTFTLYLPLVFSGPARAITVPARGQVTPDAAMTPQAFPVLTVERAEDSVSDDRATIHEGDSVFLVVDDDAHYANMLLGLARDRGFKGLVAQRGLTAIRMAREFHPDAISLDIFLPDMLGWTVLNDLKLDPATRHIPVQIVSIAEDRQHGLARGAFSYLVKPATTHDLEAAFDRIRLYTTPHTKRLLLLENDEAERRSIIELLSHDDIEITAVSSGAEAIAALSASAFECCVADLRLPDMDGFDLLERLQQSLALRDMPVVVYTGRALTADEGARLRLLASSVVLKDVRSPERLFDETSLFLHLAVSAMPEGKQQLIERLRTSNDSLRHRKVLVVDDDARNIFALTTALENHEMDVLGATSGRRAIEIVERTPDLSIILMDIMMPDMDGYETIRRIRMQPAPEKLPIVALTAKAMKGDREKCLRAGASDYIAKPVDSDQLVSLLRVWLHR